MNADSTPRFNLYRRIFVFVFACVSLLVCAQENYTGTLKLPFYVTDGVLSGDDGNVNTSIVSTYTPNVKEFYCDPILVSFSSAKWNNSLAVSASIVVEKDNYFLLKNVNDNIRIISISWEGYTGSSTKVTCDPSAGNISKTTVSTTSSSINSYITWTSPSETTKEVRIDISGNLLRINRFVIEYENLAHQIKKMTVDYKDLDIILSSSDNQDDYISWDGTDYTGSVAKAKNKSGEIDIRFPLLQGVSGMKKYAYLTSEGLQVRGGNSSEVIRLANQKAKMVAFSMRASGVSCGNEVDKHRVFAETSTGTYYCVGDKSEVSTDWGYIEGVNEVILTAAASDENTYIDGGPTWQTLDIYYYDEEEPLEKSGAPVIEGSGKFVESTVVTMSTPVSDTKIYYTTNGKDPNVTVNPNKSVQYDENEVKVYDITGITITETTEFRAVAVTKDHDVSPVVIAKFEKLSASGAPTISGEEKFEKSTTVTITAPDNNSTIYYTIDETDPKVDYINGEWRPSSINTYTYSDNIALTATAMVKAISIAPDLGPSAIVEKNFVQMPRATTPDPGISGEQLFSDDAVVNLNGIPEGAKVLYTLNGSNPTFTEDNGELQATGETMIADQGTINITQSCVLTIVVWEQNKLPSNPLRLQYTKTTATATPKIEGEHHFIGSTTVTITAPENASIFYTTDGSVPMSAASGACKLYSEPLILSETTIVKALAVVEGLLPSAIAEREFTRWERTPAPTISGDLTFSDITKVSLEGTPGGSIFYTLDNTDPSFNILEDGTVTPMQGTYLYSNEITLSAGCTLKAVAVLDGCAPSEVATAVFEKQDLSQAPVIVAPEIFYESATVTMTAVSDAKIFYTIDGTDPEVKLVDVKPVGGNLYEAPLELNVPATIKAVAWEEGKALSAIVTIRITQAQRTPKPVISLPAEFEEETEITIEAQDARVFYTIGSESWPAVKVSEEDGSISWSGETQEYTSPISVRSTTVIKAVAVGSDLRVSEITEAVTTKRGQTVVPTIIGDNPFVRETEVVLDAPITARILYTLDGSDPLWELDADGFAAPKEGSTTLKYVRNNPVKIKDRTIVRAIAHEKGKTVSEIVSITFVPADATPAPEISGRTPFAISTEVTLAADSDAKLFYTTDGSDPDVLGTWYMPRPQGTTKEYTSPFELREAATVKAVAWEKMSSLSAVSECEFQKFAQCEAPVISGTTPFESETEIRIVAPNGSVVYYSLDGSTPTASLDDNGVITGGPSHYEGSFKIDKGTIVKAIAVSPQMLPSEIVTLEFVKQAKADLPVIAGPEIFGDEAKVEIRVPKDAIVRYTLDGSEPDENSSLYEEAFIVTEPCEVRARAWKEGCQPSEVAVLPMLQMDRSEPVIISGTSPFVREMTITLTAAPEARIYYTLDGIAPSVKVIGSDKIEVSYNAILYDKPLNINTETHIIAVALEQNKRASEPVERKFERAGVTSKPVIEGLTPFLETTTVTITAAQGADIYFTLDGTEPTQSSIRYKEPFELNYSALVRAIAKLPERDFSDVAEMRFEKEELSEPPVVEAPSLFGDEAHVRIKGEGAIWYTLDGSDPQPGISDRYDGELVFTEPFTIKASAQSDGKLPSPVVEHTGRQMERTASAVISGEALFEGYTEVRIEADGAKIWYTLDGTVPEVRIIDDGEPQIGEGALLYNGPFDISSSLTVSAIAITSGKRASLVSQRAFERMDQSRTPSISGSTPFETQTLVTITAQSDAKIYFTLDGTRPQQGTSSTFLYREPLLLTATTLVRAVAVEENKAVSPVAEMLFERMAVSGKPEIELTESFGDEADVTITAAPGARIFYTTDGTLPDASAPEYTEPFVISSSAVVRAVALENGKSLSVMAEREAVQMERTSAPDIEIEEMNDGYFRVTVAAPIDASVYYSVDEPAHLILRNQEDLVVGSSTQLYGQPVKVAGGARLHAIAIRPGFRPSEMMAAVAPMRESASAPLIEGDSPFEETTLVSIEAEEGMKIFYTFDGKDPEVIRGEDDEPMAGGDSTKEYYVPFEISESMVIKAVAVSAGTAISPVAVKEFEKTDPSGIDDLSSDDESVRVGSGSISGPADMKVYDAWGRQCPHEGLRPGVYIIVTGNKLFKVMVKS